MSDFLDSLKQLGADELGEVAATAVRLRANQRGQVLAEQESMLLQQINKGLSAAEQARMDLLIEKRQAETVTEPELAELIALSDRVEEIQVERLSALIELAALRNVSLESLKESLTLPKPQ
ncbi:MAG: STAS/SEC14 domain-containing protein [Chloroflexota bacterium]